MPALHGRRGLKQRRKGFFGYCRRKCRGHRKGLSIFASSAERDLPHPDQGSNHGDAKCSAMRRTRMRRRRFTLAATPPYRIRELGGMTTRIREFLKHRTDNGPCLVVDLDVVRENYQNFAKALPDTRVYYAVKANPAPEILKLLVGLGCCFDVASLPETHDVLAAGATPDRISYGNTIKKEREIAEAFRLGVTLFAVDCEAEVEKVRTRRTRQPRDLPHPLRRLGGRVAAVAQVRLRAGLCRGYSGTGPQERPRALRHLLPRRFAAAQCRSLGSRAGFDRRGIPHLRRARHQSGDRQSRRRLPGEIHPQDAETGKLRQGDLQGAAQAFRQQSAEHHRRAGPRARRQCRRHRGRGRADRQAQPRGRGALGLSRYRQVPRSRRDHRQIDPLSDPHHA